MHAKCGSYAGYQAHLKRGELACRPCTNATLDYQNAWRALHPEYSEATRLMSRARGRAQRRVAANHPAEFAEYMIEELRVERLRHGATLLEEA